MQWSDERKKIVSGFGLALLVTGLTNLFSHQNALQLIESTAQVQHTHITLHALDDLLAILLDAESGRRGYIFSGNKVELERYNQANQRIDPALGQLRKGTANDPKQQQRLVNLHQLIDRRVTFTQQSIILYRQNPFAIEQQANLLRKNQNNRLEIRQLIAQMRAHEEKKLQVWVERSRSSLLHRQWIELLSTLLGMVILFSTFTLLYWQMLKRKEAEILQDKMAREKEMGDLKIRFFSLVSHEFRTPLSIVLGSINLLINNDRYWTEEKIQNNLQRIQSAARSMNRSLEDILTLTRAEAGKLEFNPHWLDLESFCLNLISDFEEFGEVDHPIEFISECSYIKAEFDERLLYSILGNLLSNAIKYSPSNSPIYFSLTSQSEVVIFQIKDEGIGIPKAFLSALYEPFYRAENVRDRIGTGLGLAVVKQCVDLHQGQISVESEMGRGTTFTVRLPWKRSLGENPLILEHPAR